MTECCIPEAATKNKRRYVCPVNGIPYPEVPYDTVRQHVLPSLASQLTNQAYYFCHDPGCDIVYFGEDDSVIDKTMLGTSIGIKDSSDDALVCYCFGITRLQAMTDESRKQFVIDQTRAGLCACESRNPSGRCCLRDFP